MSLALTINSSSLRKLVAVAASLYLPIALSFFHGTSGRGGRTMPNRMADQATVSAVADGEWASWSTEHGIDTSPKLSVRPPLPDERGKGGVFADAPISALEVLARIPLGLCVLADGDDSSNGRAVEAASDATKFSWALDLTAATLAALHPTEEEQSSRSVKARRDWIAGWEAGGWATDPLDLGDTKWGSQGVIGSLMSTGSDNDHNIYAKFRMPAHPTVHRAGMGLALLTGSEEDEALSALLLRGKVYRSMRDALASLVLNPTDRPKGSARERKIWDVADLLSRVLSRASEVPRHGGAPPTTGLVPLYERLGHCSKSGENVRLVAGGESDSDDHVLLLVAARDIKEGEAITRDYSNAPRLDGDETDGGLRLLLQFGLPPDAW